MGTCHNIEQTFAEAILYIDDIYAAAGQKREEEDKSIP
jgi:hypothetical protein